MAINTLPRPRRRRRPPPQLLLVVAVVLLQLASNYPSATCLHHHRYSSTAAMLVDEGKTDLLSRPPSCHNSCNRCHPCMPVLTPPLPTRYAVTIPGSQWTQSPPSSSEGSEFDIPLDGTRLADYNPPEWKCQCKDYLYDP